MRKNPYYFDGIRNKNEKVIKEFMKECYPMVASKIRSLDSYKKLPPDDIFQDALAVVFYKINQRELTEEKMTASLSTYLVAVVKNLCLTAVKSNRYLLEGAVMEVSHSSNSMWEDPAESEDIDLSIQVLELAKKVKPPCNEMLYDYYITRLSYEEIAERHGYKNYNSAKKKNGECLKKARTLAFEDPYFKSKFFSHA